MSKKKLLALLLTGAMITSTMAVLPVHAEEAAEAEATAVTTVGPDDAAGVFECWSFVDLHNEFYGKMVEMWNEQNPDKTIQVTFSTYPYADMHNKLMMSLQAGSGAPDLCDIEIGQFPNYTGADCPLYDLGAAMEFRRVVFLGIPQIIHFLLKRRHVQMYLIIFICNIHQFLHIRFRINKDFLQHRCQFMIHQQVISRFFSAKTGRLPAHIIESLISFRLK